MLGTIFLKLSLVTSDKYITLELLNPLNPKLIKNEEIANNYILGHKYPKEHAIIRTPIE